MSTITQDSYITIEYTFSSHDGTVLGSSEHNGPMFFQHGKGDVIPGLDKALAKRQVGESFECVIQPEDGYGVHDSSLVTQLPREALQVPELRIGMRLNINKRVMTVTGIDDEFVVVDANHPLAGVPLYFNITVLAIDNEKPAGYPSSCACGGNCNC